MHSPLRNIKTKLRDLAVRHAESTQGRFWLSVLSFSESIFFPVPVDPFLMALLGAQEKPRWIWYSALTAFWSVVGGIAGFLIGYFLYESAGRFLIELYDLGGYVDQARSLFNANAFWAMFIAGFTLIPYKVFTIAAGFFEISFKTFLIASIVSRFLRFFIVGLFMKLFGGHIGRFAFRYFNTFTFILLVLAIIYIIASR